MNKVSSRRKRSASVLPVNVPAESPATSADSVQTTTTVSENGIVDAANELVIEANMVTPDGQPAIGEAHQKAAKKRIKNETDVVRYSFAIQSEHALLLEEIRQTHQFEGGKLKKNVLLRAALLALTEVHPERLAQLVAQAHEDVEGSVKIKKLGKIKGKKS